MTLAAEDLIRMALAHRHFEPVAVYAPARHEKLVTGAAADPALSETMAS